MSVEKSKAEAFTSAASPDTARLKQARSHALVRQEAQRGGAQRERPNQFGGLRLQLAVNGHIPGYHLFWENDENGAVEQLLLEGFDFVTQEELYEETAKVVPDLDISSVMSRFVKGTKVDGSPLRAYLLKCTEEVWADRERERHALADQWDRDIRKQAEAPSKESGLRKLSGLDTSIDTTFRKSY